MKHNENEEIERGEDLNSIKFLQEELQRKDKRIEDLVVDTRSKDDEIDRLLNRISFFQHKYQEIITKTHRVQHVENKFLKSDNINPKNIKQNYDRLYTAYSESLLEKEKIIQSLNSEFIRNETLSKSIDSLRATIEGTIDKTDTRRSIQEIK